MASVTCRDCGVEFERTGSRGPAPVRCAECKVERRRASQRLNVPERTFRVLSLGAGQQSSALLLMSAAGMLPKLDVAVFADTGWERQVVYDHLDRLTARAAQAGIPVERVSVGNLRDDVLAADFVPMPVFARGERGQRVTFRQGCTVNWKIKPIRRRVRELAGPLAGLTVEMWLGISFDETFRMKQSRIDYIRHVYPLVDMRWERGDCQRYLAEHGFPGTPRSSCIGCPYKSGAQWREMARDAPGEFADAVEFDAALRSRPEPAYLHPSLKPLPLAVVQHGDQGDLFGEECEGYCGV